MSDRFLPLFLTVAVLAAGATGCATKKFVRNTVDPVSQQVGELDRRSTENARAIEQLDERTQREISKSGEKALAADARAAHASQQAAEALAKTGEAIERADGARTLAESGIAKASRVERLLEHLDNFRLASTTTVYFGFDKSALAEDAKKDLDEVARFLTDKQRYVIEVQGFTDPTGSSEYNYTLSGRRAESVVRYLTTHHNIPVYRVHTLGLGEDVPVEASNRREARKLSRRVQVRIFTPITQAEMAQTASR